MRRIVRKIVHQDRDVVYGDPIDPVAKRWPWYRWIPNAYRSGRQHVHLSRRHAAMSAVYDWWATR